MPHATCRSILTRVSSVNCFADSARENTRVRQEIPRRARRASFCTDCGCNGKRSGPSESRSQRFSLPRSYPQVICSDGPATLHSRSFGRNVTKAYRMAASSFLGLAANGCSRVSLRSAQGTVLSVGKGRFRESGLVRPLFGGEPR